MNEGTAMAARIPMIATTIINSMSVNPRWVFVLNITTPSWQMPDSNHRAKAWSMPASASSQKCLLPHKI
jgi:hypothetical protein